MNAVAPIDKGIMGGLNPGPAAGIVSFLRDEQARAVVMAAVASNAAGRPLVRHGGIEDAIEYLAYDPSPRTLIVDISGVSEPLVMLDRLAEVCLPGTRVIGVGETNDIHFYRLLRSAGMAEYLVKPLSAEAVHAALESEPAAALKADAPKSAGRGKTGVVVVVGSRGGVGATMVAVSLAHLSAEGGRRRTALIDLDVGGGSAALALDAEPAHGLIEALTNPDRIDGLLIASATTKITANLSLVAAEHAVGTGYVFPPDSAERLIKSVRQEFARVVLDVPRWDGPTLRQAFSQADAIVIVTDFSLAGARDSTRLIQFAQSTSPDTRCFVVGNRVDAKNAGDLRRPEIEKALGVKLTAMIPEDRVAVPSAVNSGKAVPAAAPNSPTTVILRELAITLDGDRPISQKSLFARILGGARSKGDQA